MKKSINVFLMLSISEADIASERMVIREWVVPRLKQKYQDAGVSVYLDDLNAFINGSSNMPLVNSEVKPRFAEFCNFSVLETSGIYEEDHIFTYADEVFEKVCADVDRFKADVEKDIVIGIEFEKELLEEGPVDDETIDFFLDIEADEDLPETITDSLYDLGIKLYEYGDDEKAKDIMVKYLSLLEVKKEPPSMETIQQNVYASLILADFLWTMKTGNMRFYIIPKLWSS